MCHTFCCGLGVVVPKESWYCNECKNDIILIDLTDEDSVEQPKKT